MKVERSRDKSELSDSAREHPTRTGKRCRPWLKNKTNAEESSINRDRENIASYKLYAKAIINR